MHRSGLAALVVSLSGAITCAVGCGQQAPTAAAHDAGEATIALTPRWGETLAPTSPLLLGHNAVWSRGGLGLWDDARHAPFDDVTARVRALHPGVLRFPGGTRAMRYHFDQAIGPLAGRTPQCDPFRGTTDATGYGPDEALRFAESIGAAVTLVTPWVDGSPEEAAAFVAYANADAASTAPIGVDASGKDWGSAGDWGARRAANGHAEPYAVAFVEIGNEPYLDLRVGPDVSCGRPSPFRQDERWVAGKAIPTTAADYAAQVARTGARVRAIDPRIRIGAAAYSAFDGSSDPAREIGDHDRKIGSADAWNARLVADAGASFDLFVLHPYDFGSSDARLRLADRLRTTIRGLRALDAGKGFAITEYGFLFGGATLMNALVSVDVVRVAVEERATIALRHVLIEDDPTEPFADSAALLGPAHDEQPGFHAMRLLAAGLQPFAVGVDGLPDGVTALATRDEAGRALCVALVDRRPDTGAEGPTSFDVTLPPGELAGTLSVVHASTLDATGDAVRVDDQPTSARERVRVLLPAHGLAVLRLTAR